MISEKKFQLETKKRNDIINQLRIDRNKMIVSYQKINSDLIQILERIENILKKTNDNDLKKEFQKIKDEFKNYL